ncbi:MAG: hypothetical protein IT531_14535 [Burkholderiales bacterium]|nr:hypothetical protein [Burkholderiales bacterium]
MMGARRAGWMLCALALSVLPAGARAAQDKVEPPASEWARGNRVLLGVTQPRIGLSAQWLFQRAANGDILLEKEESRAGRTEAGSLILVGSGALVARNLVLEPGRELASINGPLLVLQLVLRLLERGVPGGPARLKGDVRIDLSERAAGIKVAGIGAEGEFFAPWTLKGSVGPGASGQVKLELEFVSASGARSGAPAHETSIAGIWQAGPAASLPDSTPLRGWRVYQIRPVVKPRGAINIVGLGASAPMAFATLGEVRRQVAEWADAGARRARWQCS